MKGLDMLLKSMGIDPKLIKQAIEDSVTRMGPMTDTIVNLAEKLEDIQRTAQETNKFMREIKKALGLPEISGDDDNERLLLNPSGPFRLLSDEEIQAQANFPQQVGHSEAFENDDRNAA